MDTILIVDDEERIRKLIAAYLKKDNYNTMEAENGMDAIKILKENHIKLMILDVMMPVMDGWTVLNEVRKFSNIPVIMLTAKSEEEDTLLAFELGTDIYLTKPFSPKVLVANVKASLKRSYNCQGNNNKVCAFEGIHIDKNSHRVTIDEKEINLLPKEFQLLVYFMDNNRLVLTREQILNAVWGNDYYGDLRTVDTHIRRLREKLGTRAYAISTIRGYGYKFEVKNEG